VAVEAGQLPEQHAPREAPAAHVQALAAAGAALAEAGTLEEALSRITRAAADGVGASLAVARTRDGDRLVARSVAGGSRARAALLEGSSVPALGLADDGSPPPAVAAVAASVDADAVLAIPVRLDGEPAGSLELMRRGAPYSPAERELAAALAAHVAAAIRTFAHGTGRTAAPAADGALELAGRVLAAAAEEVGAAREIVGLALAATGARGCVLWRSEAGRLSVLAADGETESLLAGRGPALAEQALERQSGHDVHRIEDGARAAVVLTLPLGRPACWALQLLRDDEPSAEELARLAVFAVRGLHALRAADRARRVELELERTRALLTFAGRANEQLSLSHTLETVVERVSELLGAEQLAVYLREDGRLVPAATRSLGGPHVALAQRLLELALGPFRGRGVLVVEDAARDPHLRGLEGDLAAAGIEAAVAAPLMVPGDVTGLLAVYPRRGEAPTPNEIELVRALAAQLAVSVQNARLHEQATQLGGELEDVLALERQAARQLRALYEISRSFAQSLSLETTLDAVVRTIVELLGVDAAVIRMPDERGELLVPRASHVSDARLGEAVRAVLGRPQPLEKLPGRRLFRRGEPLVLDAESAARLGPGHELLVPFLRKGSTAAELPISTPTELLGTVTLLSLDPERPLDRDTLDVALSVAAQAALAIDNARLYQHQKRFADTMQRSLLPRTQPEVRGIDVGDVYESSARVEVGGDVYDFLTLDDGRLAVVLGDVTGHGIDAAADMAMAKFVFRSLAREHSEPGEFLAAANRVVCDEIAPAKFITMLYLTVDGETGELACASAGHPQPRLVLPDGRVRPVDVGGLALGIDPDQAYEEAREHLPAGASVVVYTDGVVEARNDGELYGSERLDRVLAERRALPAGELARAVLADCRAYSRGDLADDCALVVIKRTAD
jgi:serine phosphatase RsbU (regulator of sigma subunit)